MKLAATGVVTVANLPIKTADNFLGTPGANTGYIWTAMGSKLKAASAVNLLDGPAPALDLVSW